MKTVDFARFSRAYFATLRSCLETDYSKQLDSIRSILAAAYKRKKTIFIIGNGGSATTASHMACDLSKTVTGPDHEGVGFRVIALTDNVPLITAWANDLDYCSVFLRQLRNLCDPGDVLIVVSGSGNSPNIVAAVECAKKKKMATIGLLGFDGGKAGRLVDCALIVPCREYGPVEDLHMAIAHMITSYFATKGVLNG